MLHFVFCIKISGTLIELVWCLVWLVDLALSKVNCKGLSSIRGSLLYLLFAIDISIVRDLLQLSCGRGRL